MSSSGLKELEKAKLRKEIFREKRIRLETIYPDRETLPAHVWTREFIRHCWDSMFLRYYPLWLLRRRVE